MKKNIFLAALLCCISVFVPYQASALSCAEFPTFNDMYADAEVAFRGILTEKTHELNTQERDLCIGQAGEESIADDLGLHTFSFAVGEGLKGSVGSNTVVTREMTVINCTRGGACIDMDVGKEYVVLANTDLTIQDGLCQPCPYILAEDFSLESEELCVCTMQFDPVCGKDGVTYGNDCEMACNNIELSHQGACNDDVPEVAIPSTCTSWYDGCNTCGVENGELTFCTEMACFQQETPKCLKHSFVYLNTKHTYIINNVIDEYLAELDEETKTEKVATILSKIEIKRTEILYTLSVSSFVVGSPELRSYSLKLEVLDLLETILQ